MTNAQQILCNARLGACALLYPLACEVEASQQIEIAKDFSASLHLSISISHARVEARFYGFKIGEDGYAISSSQFILPGFECSTYFGNHFNTADEQAAKNEADRINRELPLFIERVRAIIEGREKIATKTETITKISIA